MVFVNSMSDTFHEKITDEQIDKILDVCKNLREHTFQILTKRAHRVPDFLYPENVWLGVTVENKERKDRIKYLKQTDAQVKFLSCEPLLEDLGTLDLNGIDWVIVGGESGPGARPLKPEWVRNILKQCKKQNIPFFFKQWGEWVSGKQIEHLELVRGNFKTAMIGDDEVILNVPINSELGLYKLGKKYTGSMLDGKHYKEYPMQKVEV
jgi:protein gp37